MIFFLLKVVCCEKASSIFKSEDINDVMYTGQRVKWINKDKSNERHLQVDQEIKVEELSEIAFDASLRDNVVCTRDLHTQFRSVLG